MIEMAKIALELPKHRDLYYGGRWHSPTEETYFDVTSPGTGENLGKVADASADDVDAAIAAARDGYKIWRDVLPLERSRMLKKIASIIRENAEELAMLDAVDCGNPVSAMIGDVAIASEQLEFFAGLVTEMKGSSIPMGPDAVNFSVREPLGVVGKILPFNHPFMFCAGKIAAALAAGNSVVVKPPEQAPLSSLRFAELIDGLLPDGVFNLVPGSGEVGAALASHSGINCISLIGSVATGRAVMRAAAETIKPVVLELGGKNALFAFPDADPQKVAKAAVKGMNFAWCGQSCGSTSRIFVHEDIYEAVISAIVTACEVFRPGNPTLPETNMGALASKAQYERSLDYIASAKAEGARLVTGGAHPDDPALAGGYFIEPTIFADVTPDMRLAREEVFGPVAAIIKWNDREEAIEQINAVEYGLTCSIWTNNISLAHRTAMEVEAGFVWINEVAKHFLGAPFGGFKQSGIGREECIEELMLYSREKNIHINLNV